MLLRILCYSGVILGSGVLESYIPHLEITITIQSNDLTHHQPYTKKQQVVYELIKILHEEKGLGYRKISQKLNGWGIKTQRGNKWFNTSVSSVLKRKHQRDVRIEEVRKQQYQIQMDRLRLNTLKVTNLRYDLFLHITKQQLIKLSFDHEHRKFYLGYL